MATITVPRAFGGTLILNISAPPGPFINVTWVTRDLYVTWKTRDDVALWKARDDLATWKARS